MFIEEIELKGYLRLKLNQFNKIKLNFTQKIQLILGTNGAGKSSLNAELTPYPADPKGFSKDGFKRIVIRSKGKRYILTSSFDPVIHSFKIEGELDDLNPGGTITVQKELVKKHFGIDASTHALATGKHEFHSMQSSARRDWFRLLSDTNYDYAIGVYNRLKDSSRDTTGALKLARNKLVAQSSKMMPEDALEALQKDCEELYKIVELFIDNRNSPTATPQETMQALTKAVGETESMAKTVLTTLGQIDSLLQLGIVSDPKEASSLEFYISNKLIDIKEKKVSLFKENTACSEIVALYEKTKLFQAASISTELEHLKKEHKKLSNALIYSFHTHDPKYVLSALNNVSSDLLELGLNTPINEKSIKFTRELFKTWSELKDKVKLEIDNHKFKIANLEERIAHHNDHKDSPTVECPKCAHSWKPFYDENSIKVFTKGINKLSEEIAFKNTIIEDTNQKIEEFNTWMQHIEAIKDLASRYPDLKDLWSLVMKKEIVFENPRQISTIVSLYKTHLQNEITLESINEKIQAELDKLTLVENSQGLDHQQAVVTISRISDELALIAEEELRLNSMKDVVSKLALHMKKIDKAEQNLLEKEKLVKELTATHIEDLRRIMFNNILRSFQSELALKEKVINDEKLHESMLTQLKTEIESLELSSQAYKIVLKELSPSEGIIAEGLYGYIKLFVKQMNKFISSVWSYPLIVRPCVAEEGKLDLNYKFPLMVGTSDTVRTDIIEGSSSMREIINLGFTICALKTIGLGNAQLFLDEFGSNMDPVHKHQTSRMISDIADNENFSQIFIISHDITQYGSLDNAEICVLNAANVIIPSGCIYNQHVTFD